MDKVGFAWLLFLVLIAEFGVERPMERRAVRAAYSPSTSTPCPPTVWWQCTAITLRPGFSAAQGAIMNQERSMAAKDIYHDPFVRALQKDGWTITHDPLTIT